MASFRRPRSFEEAIRRLQEDDANADIASSLLVSSAIDQYRRGNTPFAPSQYDALAGAAIGGHVSQLFGPNSLAGPVAQQTLKVAYAANKNNAFGGLTPFDFVAAGAMQRNAEYLNTLLGRPPGFGGVRG